MLPLESQRMELATVVPGGFLSSDSDSSPTNNLQPWLSKRIYGLDWAQLLPFKMTDKIVVMAGSWESTVHFFNENWHSIYKESSTGSEDKSSPFLATEPHKNRSSYYRETADIFHFTINKNIVGVLIGTPLDWSSYYIRNVSILPKYQGKKIYQTFLHHFLPILKSHHVDRVHIEVSMGNLRHIHILNKLKFNVVGTLLSERWGGLLIFIKHLSPNPKRVFLKQFCQGVDFLAQEEPTPRN